MFDTYCAVVNCASSFIRNLNVYWKHLFTVSLLQDFISRISTFSRKVTKGLLQRFLCFNFDAQQEKELMATFFSDKRVTFSNTTCHICVLCLFASQVLPRKLHQVSKFTYRLAFYFFPTLPLPTFFLKQNTNGLYTFQKKILKQKKNIIMKRGKKIIRENYENITSKFKKDMTVRIKLRSKHNLKIRIKFIGGN